jgi:hypothetical protein
MPSCQQTENAERGAMECREPVDWESDFFLERLCPAMGKYRTIRSNRCSFTPIIERQPKIGGCPSILPVLDIQAWYAAEFFDIGRNQCQS